MLLSQLGKILDAIRKFADDDIRLYELADTLEMPLDRLETLLRWNNLLDGANRVNPDVTHQDIVNLLVLYYVMKPTHEFKFTVYGSAQDGYASGANHRITLQQLKKPHSTT